MRIHKLVYFLPLLLLAFACEIDQGLEPTQSGIAGTIHFSGEWPEETDQVVVVAATKFPPTAIDEIIMSEALPLFQDSVSFEIYTTPQTFAAVGLVWKEKDQPWDVTNIIAIYQTAPGFLPTPVSIPDRQTMLTGINLQADLGLAKRQIESGISGMLQVEGDWPETAEQVLVAASRTLLPTSLLDITFGTPIPAGFDSTSYDLMLQPGTYYLIGTLIIDAVEDLGVNSIKGIYKKDPNSLFPTPIVIPTDSTRFENVDITINFDGGF